MTYDGLDSLDASTFGFLNLFTRPLGGVFGDLIYRRYGVAGKKWLTLSLGFMQGAISLAMGLVSCFLLVYRPILSCFGISDIDFVSSYLLAGQWMQSVYKAGSTPDLGIQMVLVVYVHLLPRFDLTQLFHFFSPVSLCLGLHLSCPVVHLIHHLSLHWFKPLTIPFLLLLEGC